MGSANEIDKLVGLWRDSVLATKNADGDSKELVRLAAQAQDGLASRVWAPVRRLLSPELGKIWISPDGQLALLPWSVLGCSSTSSESCEIGQFDSPAQFVTSRRRPRKAAPKPSILLVGDIDYGGVPLLPTVSSFGSLKNAEKEIDTVSKLAEGAGFTVTVLSRKSATRTSTLSQLPGKRIAHFATHGYFLAGKPESSQDILSAFRRSASRNPYLDSGLALAGANRAGKSRQNGILTAEDILGLDLSGLELFTASACDTALGSPTAGQGVLGFRSAISASGAATSLLSLWKVDDDATELFMQVFYKQLLVDHLSEAQALRTAQSAVRQSSDRPEFAKPFYWEAWVLIGE